MTVGRPAGASGGAQWSRQVREKEKERNSVCARKGVSKERKLFVIALETESGACRGEVWD